MDHKPLYITAEELTDSGPKNIPAYLRSSEHLIYNSPAALDFNSPGAEGFGVKRAGLSVPGSVMLIVSPGCCARNTTLIEQKPGYRGRFFYYVLEEKDIVTGRYLSKIPEAAAEVVSFLKKKPSAIMICITCVDALLGTDMERICRKVSQKTGLPARPCYMYALTREGSRPPMVHVRQSIYSLLTPRKRKADAVNILGYFSPLSKDCELFSLLKGAGFKNIRQISACGDFDEFMRMSEANFNIVLNPECRRAADDMSKDLGIPYIELYGLYDISRIRRQYRAFFAAIKKEADDTAFFEEAKEEIEAFKKKYGGIRLSIGERQNADPFEMAAFLSGEGFKVREIFGTVTEENFGWIRRLASESPNTKIYSNLEPTMFYYDEASCDADLAIGADAMYYHPSLPGTDNNLETVPFGYQAVTALFKAMEGALEGAEKGARSLSFRGTTV